ncbi:MAG: hypothetical protein JJ863_01510 [Deltaproteobacteria bacterium]|nr:hypothetical protein [Deltaproteobacteria bacterium]
MPAPIVCYLSGPRLLVKRPGEEPLELESRFAEEVRQRAVQIRKKHEWKQQGRGAQFSGALLWGMDGDDQGPGPLAWFTALSPGRAPGEVLYALSSGRVSGVFAADARAEEPAETEQRLFHTADFQVFDLARTDDHEWVACTTTGAHGVQHLGAMREDGSDFEQLTEGDSMDRAPAWVPGVHAQLVYESAGVGRDAAGQMVGFGPTSVQRLDVPSSEVSTVLEDAKHDHLAPRLDASGRLLCIRRPWHDPSKGALASPKSVGRALMDFVLFPFRLIFALFAYLNFFTASYTGKPLTTAGGPEKQGRDARQLAIWGNLLAAGAVAPGKADEPRDVPSSWQLLRWTLDDEGQPKGDPEVLAKSVADYHLASDGSVVFTTGRTVVCLSPDGSRETLVEGEHIRRVVVLGD